MPTLAGIEFVRGDIGDRELVRATLVNYRVTAVTHFAGKIQVAESVAKPGLYFEHNVVRTLALLDVARDHVGTFVFSSTAVVYGMPECFAGRRVERGLAG